VATCRQLAALFSSGVSGQDYPTPSKIYAADPTATPDDDLDDEPSQRPFETIEPLADRLGLTPDTTYAVGQEDQLASKIAAQTGVVLVAWEHKAIAGHLLPAIVKIVNAEPPPGIPTKWEGTRFDVVLRFDRGSPEAPWSFRQLLPCLLSGDLSTPMT
jgi:hypothetical protein